MAVRVEVSVETGTIAVRKEIGFLPLLLLYCLINPFLPGPFQVSPHHFVRLPLKSASYMEHRRQKVVSRYWEVRLMVRILENCVRTP